ncbi:MAG: FAD-dependent monooxygenase [Anaerolineae bacterium]|jgi:2-polyprenyl-6-methoxyphenol hydroxylase-like FAD-dependent oxidoreductase|nr:FAD-dependent monooxygenase [Anaerolineae bacterium]
MSFALPTKRGLGQRAVVIGGSIAGLSAARALSPHFDEVVVVERGDYPQTSAPRKATPQGNHVHALLKSGEEALETLFPGLKQTLIDNGAQQVDFSGDVHWFHHGQWKMRYDSGFKVMVQTRPLVEWALRGRLDRLANIKVYSSHEVGALLTTADHSTITGVTLHAMDDRAATTDLTADLVVEATGRGSKLPQWLEALGYSAPPETRLNIGLGYSSRLYQAPDDLPSDWRIVLLNPQSPTVLRAGYIFPVEGNRWLVTLGGYSGDAPPSDHDGFMAFAKDLAQPVIYEWLQKLIPIGEIKSYAVPDTVRRHYEKLSRLPKGIVALGDAFCVFDPVFGQGMSTAAKAALALCQQLDRETPETVGTLAQRYHKKVAHIVNGPWMLATSEDFRYPKTVGPKPIGLPVLHWYSGHIFALSASDREVFETFRQVMHLLTGIEALFKPSIVLKVLRHSFSRT